MTIDTNMLSTLLDQKKSMTAITGYFAATTDLTGSDIRNEIEKYMTENNLIVEKEMTKGDQLKEWFLSQENPLKVTKKDVKKQCEDVIGMKGGSITYYVNAYMLTIELTNKVNSK